MDRDLQIVKQSCLKVAATALQGRMPSTFDTGNVYSEVVELAEMFVEWVNTGHNQAVQNVVSALPGTEVVRDTANAPQPPQNGSQTASLIPTVCPNCGCKVRDNRAANIKRGDEGKPALPELKCGGKVHRAGNQWITDQQPCDWKVWKVTDLQPAAASEEPPF